MLHPDVYVQLTNLHISELQREAERRRLVRLAREGRLEDELETARWPSPRPHGHGSRLAPRAR